MWTIDTTTTTRDRRDSQRWQRIFCASVFCACLVAKSNFHCRNVVVCDCICVFTKCAYSLIVCVAWSWSHMPPKQIRSNRDVIPIDTRKTKRNEQGEENCATYKMRNRRAFIGKSGSVKGEGELLRIKFLFYKHVYRQMNRLCNGQSLSSGLLLSPATSRFHSLFSFSIHFSLSFWSNFASFILLRLKQIKRVAQR